MLVDSSRKAKADPRLALAIILYEHSSLGDEKIPGLPNNITPERVMDINKFIISLSSFDNAGLPDNRIPDEFPSVGVGQLELDDAFYHIVNRPALFPEYADLVQAIKNCQNKEGKISYKKELINRIANAMFVSPVAFAQLFPRILAARTIELGDLSRYCKLENETDLLTLKDDLLIKAGVPFPYEKFWDKFKASVKNCPFAKLPISVQTHFLALTHGIGLETTKEFLVLQHVKAAKAGRSLEAVLDLGHYHPRLQYVQNVNYFLRMFGLDAKAVPNKPIHTFAVGSAGINLSPTIGSLWDDLAQRIFE